MDSKDIYIRIQPQHTNYINQIMEGYEYLGVVTTVKGTKGVLLIRTTPDTHAEVREILKNLTIEFEYLAFGSY